MLSAIGQPSNDNCSGALFLTFPSTGDTCFTVDNTNATSDGYFNTCDQSATFPLPPGGDEIWFSYIAPGDSNFISVSPSIGPGAMVDPSITVITGNCGSFSTLACDNPIQGTLLFNVPAGTRVWFYVTALTTNGKAEVCIQSFHKVVYSGSDCSTATKICDKLRLSIKDGANFNSGGMLAGCFSNPPPHTLWLQFTVGTSGSLEFIGIPSGPQAYFWALWDVSNGCSASSITSVACNSVYSSGQTFGMNDTVTSCLNSSFCPSVSVIAGNTYALMIDDTSLSHQGFDLVWGGTFEMAPTSDFTLSDNLICSNDSVILSYSGNASLNALFNWNYGGANPQPLSNESYTLNFPGPGSYLITLQVAETGCASSLSSQQVVVSPIPSANAGSDVSFCSGSGQFPIGVPPIPGYIYHWTPTLNLVNPDSSQTLVNGVNQLTTPDTIVYTLTTIQGICQDSDNVNVIINPRQSPVIFPVAPQCFNSNLFTFITFNDSVPGTTFNWSFQNAVPSTSNAASPNGIRFNTPGQHLVTLITKTPGCPADTSVDSVIVKSNPVVSFYSSVNSGCPPLQVNLVNTSPFLSGGTYLWNPGNGSIDTTAADSITVKYNSPGVYYPMLTLTSSDNCSTTDTVNTPINVFPYPNATFFTSPPDPDDLNPVVSFSNTELNGICHYDFGDGDSSIDCQAVHTYPDTGHYQVQLIVTSVNGCVDTTYRIIEIKKFFTLYIPNAFTPNDDGRNDLLILKGEGVMDFRFRVFNRRGQMVFQSRNIANSWNGAHLDTGKQVPEGAYMYDLRVEDTNQKKHQYNGIVNVVR